MLYEKCIGKVYIRCSKYFQNYKYIMRIFHGYYTFLKQIEREQQETMKEKEHQDELMRVWNMQIRGKELLKEEVAKVAEEDRMEMCKLEEQMKKEKMEGLLKTRKTHFTSFGFVSYQNLQRILC